MAIRALPLFTAVFALFLLLVAPAAHAAFPGENGKLAYQSDGDIWTMNADGSAQTNIANTPGVTEDAAAWSPDGRKIVFISSTDVWSMNADGSGRMNLTASYPCDPSCFGIYPTRAAWSPDGAKIAFTNIAWPCEESIAGLATVDADGTNGDATGMWAASRRAGL